MATVIGITGGIGSGKSTASQILGELGATVIDADLVGHKIYLPDTPAWREIVEAFGPDVLAADRTVDRSKLGPIESVGAQRPGIGRGSDHYLVTRHHEQLPR